MADAKGLGKYFTKFTWEVVIGGALAILIANAIIKKYSELWGNLMAHLYRKGAKKKELRAFERKYGRKGKYIYGAVVGKVKRERQRKYR